MYSPVRPRAKLNPSSSLSHDRFSRDVNLLNIPHELPSVCSFGNIVLIRIEKQEGMGTREDL